MFKRSLFAQVVSLLLVVAMLGGTTPSVFAGNGGPPEDVARKAVEGTQIPSDILAKLVPYMSISDEGLFTLSKNIPSSLGIPKDVIKSVEREFSEINGHLKQLPRDQRPYVVERNGARQVKWSLPTSGEATASGCVHVAHWILDVVAWTAILYGAGLVTIGLFAEGTIYGIPVGALLQAIGLWDGVSGYFFMWIADTYYPNGVDVCW